MPKRWERELRRLGDVPAPTERIRARSTRPSEPRQGDGMPPTRQRVLAGVVAFGVFIAAGAFLVRAVTPSERDRTVGPAPTVPILQVSLEARAATGIGSDPAPWQIEAVIEYGEVRDESVTTSPPGRLPTSLDELPQLFPAPVAGSPVSIESEAYNPRVMILRAEDWPNFDRLERIDRLPPEPGDYVMLIEAEFPTGPARVVRAVSLVEPGTAQIVATEGGGAGKATASIAIDGALTDGIRRVSSFHYSDVLSEFPGEPPPTTPTFLRIESEADVVVGEGPTDQQLRISAEPPPWDDGVGTRLPGESLDGIDGGRYLLTYDVAWKHGKVSWASEGTLETARFAFPIEIVEAADVDGSVPLLELVPPRSFDAQTLDARPLDPRDFQERAIIAVAWSTRCDPCVDTLAEIHDLTEVSRLSPTAIGIVERSDADRARQMARDLDISFPSVIAETDRSRWGIEMLPSVWVMAPDGRVVAQRVGSVDPNWFADAVYEATFGEAPAEDEPTALPGVLRVRCTDAGAEVLTPEVAARADGLHVEATPDSVDHADVIELRPLGWPVVNFSSGSSGIEGVFVRAVPEGKVIVSCHREEDGGGRITPEPRDGEAIARVADPGDFYTPWIPGCALEDQVAFDAGARSDLAGLEGADAVRALIPAVRPSDDVVPGGYGAERSLFSVMRGGNVLGSVWLDSDTGETRISSGFVCAGSGIEDGFDSYPAWEGDS